MGLDIWFTEDVRNVLLAANEASAATAAVMAEARQAQGSGQAVTDSADLLAVTLRAYREGYKSALVTVALAFGLSPQALRLRPVEPVALPDATSQEGEQSGGGIGNEQSVRVVSHRLRESGT